jgi:hypothetical protein
MSEIRINRLPEPEHMILYEMGCELQNLEIKLLARLAEAESRAS